MDSMQSRRELSRVIRASLRMLPQTTRRRLWLLLPMQAGVALMDVFGIVLLTSMLSVVATGSENGIDGYVLIELGPFSTTLESNRILPLAAFGAALLTIRPILSLIILRRSARILADAQSDLAADLSTRYLFLSPALARQRNSNSVAFALADGVTFLIVGVLGGAIVLVTEAFILVGLTAVLFAANWFIALVSLTFFTLVGFALNRYVVGRSRLIGVRLGELQIQGRIDMQNALGTLREAHVLDLKHAVGAPFRQNRRSISTVAADGMYYGLLPKYLLEVALIVQLALVTSILFILYPAQDAFAQLSLFALASLRIIPSFQRVQNAAISIVTQGNSAGETLLIWQTASRVEPTMPVTREAEESLVAGRTSLAAPEVRVSNLTVQYPGATTPALVDISFTVNAGSLVIVTGESGSGKTTLLDALMGLIPWKAGSVQIGGLVPGGYFSAAPGASSYLPQQVYLIDGTLKENLSWPLPPVAYSDDDYWDSLELVGASSFARALPKCLDEQLGEWGGRLSGGQRQRINFARALMSKPSLLFVDEATSALDPDSESVVLELLRRLQGNVTILAVTHRSTHLSIADTSICLAEGRIVTRP